MGSATESKSFLKTEEEYEKQIFINDLNKEIGRVRRYGSSFSLLFLDLDGLQHINQLHGRSSGDLAIKTINETLEINTRNVDIVYRIGHDKFALFIPNSDLDGAQKVSVKLQKIIRNVKLMSDGEKPVPFGVTVSMGVASFSTQTVPTLDEILTLADRLMTEAKTSGRNRVKVYHHEGQGVIRELEEKASEVETLTGRFVIKGIPVSRGIAMGRAYIYKDILAEEFEYYQVNDDEVEKELERVKNAFLHVEKDIEKMERQLTRNLGKEYADIFMVHKAILKDLVLVNEMEEQLRRERMNAEHIVKTVFRRFENRLMVSDSQLTRERSADIADLSRRVLRRLSGLDRNIFGKLPRNRVVVTKRLLPSESVHLRKGRVSAIVTEKGSKTSHAAILARGLGIPYVSEIDRPVETIKAGDYLIVDSNAGRVIVNPSIKERREVWSQISLQQKQNFEMVRAYNHIRLEKNGRRARVLANATSAVNIREAAEYGCDGIGLYRIEQLYMQSSTFPTHEQLVRELGEMFEELPGKPITVRLLDVGGDKTLPYMNMKTENYSFMGMRGIRFLLRYPRILETQLLAFLELSHAHKIQIMVPLVTLPDEMVQVRQALEKCKLHLAKREIPFNRAIKLGAMIEVPAAVLKIEELLEHTDFVSLGTNDLIQYTMASNRENEILARYYEAGGDTVLPYIAQTVREANKRNIDCSLCGELAGDINFTEKLLRLGLENFSVAPSNILKLKSRIAEIWGIAPSVPVAAGRS